MPSGDNRLESRRIDTGSSHRSGNVIPIRNGDWSERIRWLEPHVLLGFTALQPRRQTGETGIEVRVEDEAVRLTQKLIAVSFGVTVATVSEHLRSQFSDGEIQENSVVRKFRTTAADGKQYLIAFYNLDDIIAVGLRVPKMFSRGQNTGMKTFVLWILSGAPVLRADAGRRALTASTRHATDAGLIQKPAPSWPKPRSLFDGQGEGSA